MEFMEAIVLRHYLQHPPPRDREFRGVVLRVAHLHSSVNCRHLIATAGSPMVLTQQQGTMLMRASILIKMGTSMQTDALSVLHFGCSFSIMILRRSDRMM